VETGDGRLYVRRDGSGPDVVIVHGLGDSSAGWRKVATRLRRSSYRVTLFDALGAGRSDKPTDADYGIQAHQRRLATILRALEIRSAILLASSFGGSIALLHALTDPSSVQRLVLLCPAAYPEGGWLPAWLRSLPRLCEAVCSLVPLRWLTQAALRATFGDERRLREEHLELYYKQLARPGALRALALQHSALLPPAELLQKWISRYPTLRVPTLVLWGTRDRILPPRLGLRLTRELPRAKLVRLAGVGHAMALEAPERVVAEVLRFLGRPRARAAAPRPRRANGIAAHRATAAAAIGGVRGRSPAPRRQAAAGRRNGRGRAGDRAESPRAHPTARRRAPPRTTLRRRESGRR
jgi:pimeloyl-ACP methyl ester carboxylesterase